jgi:hypothetical protein
MKLLKFAFLAAILTAAICSAGITPAMDVVPSQPVILGSGLAQWTYNISVDANASLNPAANASATCLASIACDTFWTLYDFPGFTGVTALPAGWGYTVQDLGITPGGQILPDDAALANITFYYTGPVSYGEASDADGFSITSIYGAANPDGLFSYQDTVIQTNLPGQGQGFVTIPSSTMGGAPQDTPEALSLFMVGAGLLGMASIGRKAVAK